MTAPIITRTRLRGWGSSTSGRRIATLIPKEGLTLREILALPIPAADRVWIACRKGSCPPRVQRLLAVRCARRALARGTRPFLCSVAAIAVAERHADGLATDAELRTARARSRHAVDELGVVAGLFAALPTARASTAGAWAAAAAAAAAARPSAWDAADAACDAACDAAYAAATLASEREAQLRDLLELLDEEDAR